LKCLHLALLGNNPLGRLTQKLRLTRDQVACGKHEGGNLAIIEAHCSEVRLEPSRETDGHGQGSGLSGEAESKFTGFRFAPFAAAN
jgi:hypothetical protein